MFNCIDVIHLPSPYSAAAYAKMPTFAMPITPLTSSFAIHLLLYFATTLMLPPLTSCPLLHTLAVSHAC